MVDALRRAGLVSPAYPPRGVVISRTVRSTREYKLDPLACAYCAKCHDQCPTYEETGNEGFAARGKILLASALRGDFPAVPPSLLNGALDAPDLPHSRQLREYLDFCLRCYHCLDVCPAQMRTVPIFEAMRAELAREEPSSITLRWIMRSILPNRKLTRWLCALAALFQPLMPVKRVRMNPKLWELVEAARLKKGETSLSEGSPTAYWRGGEYPLPAGAGVRARALAQVERQEVRPPERGTIAYFPDCLTDIHFPQAFAGTVKLLNHLGYRVKLVEDAPCCGASALNTGDEAAFHLMARKYAKVMAGVECDAVLFSNPTCFKTVKERYPEVLSADELARLPQPVLDVELYAQLPAPKLQPGWERLRIAWHNPCALGYALGDKSTALGVLRRWGLDAVQFNEVDGCCGYGGMFYLRYPEFAAAQSAKKLRHWRDAGVDLALSCSAGCIGHLNATAVREGIALPTMHWGELGHFIW